MVAAGAAWSLLERANFAVVDLEQFKKRLKHPDEDKSLEFSRISKANSEAASGMYTAYLSHETADRQVYHVTKNDDLDKLKGLRAALATIDKSQADERVNATDAANVAFDYVASNAFMMLAVVVSTGWTARFTKADSTQLGSLLNVMCNSFNLILSLKEIKINRQALKHCNKRYSKDDTSIGFIQGTAKPRRVRMRDLLQTEGRSTWDKLCFVVFGPAYALFPTSEDFQRLSNYTKYNLHVDVRGKPVVMTTEGTDSHLTNKKGMSLESISVCYLPPYSCRRYVPATRDFRVRGVNIAGGTIPNKVHQEKFSSMKNV
ncbi:hypothetical protein BDD12DRAFT_875815 [Trichophaea hybrida]|nr:hypothetical protein BDD12DRAFT_875815 [Trichophaea hybrida]